MRQRSHIRLALLACILFFLAGQCFIPLLGIEDDESLFASPLLKPRASHFILQVGHSHFPLMVMSYIGTLKTLLYNPIFRIFHPGVWSTRDPMILVGLASIWLFYCLLRRTAGARTAAIGAILLATDSCYLLTTCFDWGPVALQHLLLIGGVYLLVRFAQEHSHRALAGGFFLFGLALWDKALAVWMISGLAIAAAIVFGRAIATLVTPRRLAFAVLAFTLGASPLLIFNARTGWSTFRGNVKRDTSDIAGKARLLANTVNGQGLFGYLTNEDWQTPRPRPPRTALERGSARLANTAGHPRHDLMLYAVLLALLLSPLGGWRVIRTVAFCLVALALAWIQMAVTANTGGSVHHTILLWPLPVWIVAVSLTAAAERLGRAGAPALAAVVAVLVVSNLLVMNEYHVMMARDGGSVSWSDAIFPLTTRLDAAHAPAIFCADWGIQDSLRLLGRGRLVTWDLTEPAINPRVFADPAYLFIVRAPDLEVFQGTAARLIAAAAAAGYRRDLVATIPDSFNHATFEIYRFLK